MRISNNLEKEEIQEVLNQFYEYFENGYAFEEFLKEYLQRMGLEEVEVTQRSRDGGIDLKAIRKGIGDFSSADITPYYIQAKRYMPGKSKVGESKVREFRGVLPIGSRGIIITTSYFTKSAIESSYERNDLPLVLIDGEKRYSFENGKAAYERDYDRAYYNAPEALENTHCGKGREYYERGYEQ